VSDKELLKLAAKSIDLYLEWDGDPDEWQPIYYEGKSYYSWNPLEDDGDAFRLAVKCGLIVHGQKSVNQVYIQVGEVPDATIERIGKDACAATRRAIVRAAAEIGKSTK